MRSTRKTPPPDQAARDRICRDLGTTFLVEAGAGSGKTKSLVDRMIALLAAGRTTIDTLAAVTFTRKAAAELRGRFQVALERRRIAEKDPAVRDRLDAALTGLERSFIGTIHSFCARLLRERPSRRASIRNSASSKSTRTASCSRRAGMNTRPKRGSKTRRLCADSTRPDSIRPSSKTPSR